MNKNIRIVERQVDWGDDPAWVTMLELGCVGPSLGRPELIVQTARIALRHQRGSGRTVYINPAFTITSLSGQPTPEFLAAARRAQLTHLRQFRSILSSSRQLKRELQRVDPITRQLTYTGIMLIDGHHVHPARWHRVAGTIGRRMPTA